MGKYFTIYTEESNLQYPQDIKKIRAYLEDIGDLNCTDYKLDELWARFSDDCYAAGWMIVDDKILEHFAIWLDDYEEE